MKLKPNRYYKDTQGFKIYTKVSQLLPNPGSLLGDAFNSHGYIGELWYDSSTGLPSHICLRNFSIVGNWYEIKTK
jgi:hypothetical protein